MKDRVGEGQLILSMAIQFLKDPSIGLIGILLNPRMVRIR